MTAGLWLRVRKYRFWLLTFATVLSVALTASLGFWQLRRASEKELLLERREHRQTLDPIAWEDLRAAHERQELPLLYDRAVHLRGHWLHEATVYLENRQMDGRPGFIVVTPLQAEGAQVQLVVQRGWVPRRFDDRNALPALPQSQEMVEVHGRLAPLPSKLYEPGPASTGLIRQNIDLDAYAAEWKLFPMAASLLQADSGPDGDGLVRHWPALGLDVHKHYGYAFQWFGLSALLVILYVWFQLIAPRRRV